MESSQLIFIIDWITQKVIELRPSSVWNLKPKTGTRLPQTGIRFNTISFARRFSLNLNNFPPPPKKKHDNCGGLVSLKIFNCLLLNLIFNSFALNFLMILILSRRYLFFNVTIYLIVNNVLAFPSVWMIYRNKLCWNKISFSLRFETAHFSVRLNFNGNFWVCRDILMSVLHECCKLSFIVIARFRWTISWNAITHNFYLSGESWRVHVTSKAVFTCFIPQTLPDYQIKLTITSTLCGLTRSTNLEDGKH